MGLLLHYKASLALLSLVVIIVRGEKSYLYEENPNLWSPVNLVPNEYGDLRNDYEDYDIPDSKELAELMNEDADIENYEDELKELVESINSSEDELEEEEDDHFLRLLDLLEDSEDLEETEESTYTQTECDNLNCNTGGPEHARRQKRSPSPGISRSSSSRGSSSSSRGSSSSSSSRSSSSSSSSTGGGWFSRRSNRGSSSSRRGGSSSSSTSSTSSSGSSRGSSTGTGVLTGAGAGATAGSTSGSSKPYPVQPGSSGGYPTGTQPGGGYPGGTRPGGGYPTGTQPGSGYPTGTQPGGGYPGGTRPGGGYPTGTQPGSAYPTGTQPVGGYPGGGYPTGSQPGSGYPTGTQPGSGYPTGTQPVGGYPTGTQPIGWNPSGTRPGGSYPTNTQPVGGYPTGTQPVGGYPSGTRPGGSYPTNTQPVGGYPTGTQSVGGYPSGARPGGLYPTNTQPVPGYPGYSTGSRPFGSSNQPFGSVNQPYGGYPTGGQTYGGGYSGYNPYGGYSAGGQSFGGFSTGSKTYGGFPSRGLASGGFAAGAFAGGGYPAGGYPLPQRKTKKEKVKEVLQTAATAYVAHKAMKKNKFLSPFGHSYGHSHKGFGGGGLGGLAGGALAGGALGAVGKTGKKILGAYVKIQIAKYALKFGASAAKAYFEYKLGRELDEYMIGKFVHRYHQHRVRGSSRWRHRSFERHTTEANDQEADNITLGEFCLRPCNETEKLVCQFSFEVHLYQTMSRACYHCPSNSTDCERPECVTADGTRRMIVAVNKAIPGPAIKVCAGDKVLVDVFNNLPSSAVTLHWHGLTLGPSFSVPTANPTPYMDGTPGVTQCPIPPGSGFRYSFEAADPGTHFWHAQTGLERGDGVFGPLVVHQPADKDPMLSIPEHFFVVNDWFSGPTQINYVLKQHSGEDVKPQSLLINGQGRLQHDGTGSKVPYFNFMVEKNKRYRLRIINAATTNCPVTISLDSHDLILLAADGSAINPVNTSSVLIHPGERYDAMFSAEQESGDDGETFWVRVAGGNDCQNLVQYATLQYLPTNISAVPIPTISPDLTPPSQPLAKPGMNVFTGSCTTPGQRCVSGLRSSMGLPEVLKTTKANFTFYLSFSRRYIHNENIYSLLFYGINNVPENKRVATPQINNLSFRGAATPLLLNQRPLKSENCSAEGVRRGHCTEDFCECLHVIQVPVGAPVDLVLIGEDPNASHPIHLHGYKFWVLSHVEASMVPEITIPANTNITLDEGMSRDKVIRLDEEGSLTRNLESPAIKDSITVPPGGYAVVRIAAENKGFWLLESQNLFDSESGMKLILQVGTPEDLPKAPRDFPTC